MHEQGQKHGDISLQKMTTLPLHHRVQKSTFVSGAEIMPSLSLGEPMTKAQYLWVVASQALFHIYKISWNRNRLMGINN